MEFDRACSAYGRQELLRPTFVGKASRNRELGRIKKTDFGEIVYEYVNRIEATHYPVLIFRDGGLH